MAHFPEPLVYQSKVTEAHPIEKRIILNRNPVLNPMLKNSMLELIQNKKETQS
jgi:hypothetical protein